VKELSEANPSGGHFCVNSVERASGMVERRGFGCPATQSLDGGGGTAGDTAASTVGTATTSTVADGASSVTVATHSTIYAKHALNSNPSLRMTPAQTLGLQTDMTALIATIS
jgi:hypothetical protein